MNNYTIEQVKRFREFGDVTRSDVAFDWYLASSAGAGFILIREPRHTDDDIRRAKDQIRSDRDVVCMRVTRVDFNSKEETE